MLVNKTAFMLAFEVQYTAEHNIIVTLGTICSLCGNLEKCRRHYFASIHKINRKSLNFNIFRSLNE